MPPESLVIRSAKESDAVAMLDIYRPYVESTAISFEAQVPSPSEYQSRVRKYIEGWACLVAETEGRVVGYAYGSSHRDRSAYQWSVETSIYVAPGCYRSGIGRSLYGLLLTRLADAGFCNAYGGTTLPNPASVGLHLALGFKPIGTFPRVGNKFDQWHDVAWFHRVLREQRD